MTSCGTRICDSILIVPVLWVGMAMAQNAPEAQALDATTPVPPPVISPVPPPEIPIGGRLGENQFELPENVNLRNMGGPIEGNPSQGWLTFGGPIKLTTDTGLEVFSDRAKLDSNAKTITLEGNVSIYQGDTLQRGKKAVYHYEDKSLDTTAMKISVDPILMESGQFTLQDVDGQMVFVGTDAGITTHDDEQPNFWIRSSETRVYPDDKIVFRNLKLEAGGVPIFWLPYFSQPLDSELGYSFIPGIRTNWGPYLLNTYGIMLGKDPDTTWLSRWKIDARTRRGLGFGLDLVDLETFRQNRNLTGFSLYFLDDLDPDVTRSGRPAQGDADSNRFRIGYRNRFNLRDTGDANWRLDANLTWISDDRFLDDFDPQQFRRDPAPDQTIGVFRRDETSLFSFFSRLQLNEFYRADTRLPEIALDQVRRPVFGMPLFHEGTTSWAYLQEQSGTAVTRAILNPLLAMDANDPRAAGLVRQLSGSERVIAERISALPIGDPRREALASQLLDFGFARFHAFHEFSMPFKLGDVVTINPQVGLGYTRYDNVDNPLANFDRTHLHFSTEASIKLVGRDNSISHPSWGIDGLKHVFQPYSQFSFLSSDSLDANFIGIDRLTPTTRPLPIDPLRFVATDRLTDWQTVRFGGRNRLLTRRDGQSHEWLYLDSFLDFFLENPENNRNVSNLNNAIRWNPLPWLGMDTYAQFPIVAGGAGFNEISNRVRFMPNPETEISLGYLYVNNHPILLDSTLFDLSLYRRINENWGLGSRHMFEMDDNTLEVQQYTIHRNLNNWVIGVGITQRNNRVRNEYGLVFSVSLRDIPSISLPFQIDVE